MYAQQGYVFGRVSLCVYICMSTKNRLFSALLPLENLLLSVICCLLFLCLNTSSVVCYVQ